MPALEFFLCGSRRGQIFGVMTTRDQESFSSRCLLWWSCARQRLSRIEVGRGGFWLFDEQPIPWRWVWQTCLTVGAWFCRVVEHSGRMTWFFRCPSTLPMGFSWRVQSGKCACEALFNRATRLELCLLVNDHDQAPVFQESPGHEGDDKFGYVYVDNIGVLTTSPRGQVMS